MIKVNNLIVEEKRNLRKLFNDFSFVINSGMHVGIIGSEGNGKSTLLKIINQEELDYLKISVKLDIKGTLGYLEQNIADSYQGFKTEEFLLYDKDTEEIDYNKYGEINKNLQKLDFNFKAFDLNKTVESYSGGERVKLALLKLMIFDYENILLDEPSNDLDFDSLLFLEDFINSSEKTILFISHDVRLLENTAEQIIHLDLRERKTKAVQVFSALDYKTYVKNYHQKRQIDQSKASLERRKEKIALDKFRKIYERVQYQQNQAVRNPALAKSLAKKIGNLKSIKKKMEKKRENFTAFPDKIETIFLRFVDKKINQNKVCYSVNDFDLKIDDRCLVKAIDFSFNLGDKILISGNNGVGKSTFLKEIMKHLAEKSDLKCFYMPQDYQEILDYEKTVIENLTSSFDLASITKIKMFLGSLLFNTNEMEYKVKEISYGMKAKVIMLKMVLEEPDVLILDEPTRNIASLNMPDIYDFYNSFNGGIIAVSHDRSFIENCFDKFYQIKDEKLLTI